jgi:exosortase D (VPLPA-CTERM-specific)
MSKKANRFPSAAWLRVVIYAFLMTALYRTTLVYLASRWAREDFAYGYFILPIVLYLLWERRVDLYAIPSTPSWAGIVPIGAGVALYWLGELGGEYTTLFLSLWLVVVGLCWIHLGSKKLKAIGFPLAFLLVMFPPPQLIYSNISLQLKLVSSRVGVWMLQVLGMTAYREGNIIDLGFTQLQVVDACSGLRYLFPLAALGFLLAYYWRVSFSKRAFMVSSVVPVTIFTNSIRIASVGVLYRYFGAMVAEGFFHGYSGWLIFMVSLGVLLGEMRVLSLLFPEKGSPPAKSRMIDEMPVLPSSGDGTGERSGGIFRPPQSVAAVILLGATLLVSRNVNFREKVPLGHSLSRFPLLVGGWTGNRTPMEQRFLDALKLSDYAIIDYRDPEGKSVNLYVAYNESQSKGASSHSPDSCLPGSGWVFEESGTVILPAEAGIAEPMRIRRAFIRKDGEKKLTYYWFPQRGRVLTNMLELKAYAFWDALTQRRTDGALVRLITPVYPEERSQDAEARLTEFTRRIVPILDAFLPGAG